jgi:hypothetical protein
VQPLWKTVWRLLKKLKIDLLYNPAIPLLGTYTKECDSDYYTDTCTPMFMAALFTRVKLWNQPRHPTTDEWIKKMWYLYTMEFYSATKKNEILSFASKWMELENIILSEVRLNAACFLSYVDYRPKTNAAVLWVTDHTKGRPHIGGIGQGRATKNLNVIDVLTVQE